MKKAAIFLSILLILALGGIGFLYVDCAVTVSALGVAAVEASTQPDLFSRLSTQVEQKAVTGICYTDASVLGSDDQYQFLTYNIRLRNTCYLTADQIEVQITPQEGDILQIGDTTPKMLHAQSTGDLQVTILTGINMHTTREITITYYMWGLPFKLSVNYIQ